MGVSRYLIFTRSYKCEYSTAEDTSGQVVYLVESDSRNRRILLLEKDDLFFRIWIKGIHGPHDGTFLEKQSFAVTETDTSLVAVYRLDGLLGPRLRTRLPLPDRGARYWTRGLAITTSGGFMVGCSVWKGDERSASVVHLGKTGDLIAEYELSLPDYPECRIFQIIPSPMNASMP